jgi:uncharacterized protein
VLATTAVLAAGSGIGNEAHAGGAKQQDRVVYHLNEGLEQSSNGLRNINNHLQVNGDARIVVVSHARGVDFLMKGARDKNGNLYEPVVEHLKFRGVQFDVCEITLQNRKLSKEQFIDSVTFVPSGVAESHACSSARAMPI